MKVQIKGLETCSDESSLLSGSQIRLKTWTDIMDKSYEDRYNTNGTMNRETKWNHIENIWKSSSRHQFQGAKNAS